MNSAKNHISAPLSCHLPDFIATQSVGRMNADAYRVPRLNLLRIHLKKRFINQNGITKAFRGGRSENVLPSGSDHCGSKRNTARVDQVNVHSRRSLYPAKAQPTFATNVLNRVGLSDCF